MSRESPRGCGPGGRRGAARGRRALGMASPSVPACPAGRALNEREPPEGGSLARCSGSDLLSHPVARAVPSALEGLTSGFGMGPGVSPPPWPPKRRLGSAGIRRLEGASSEQSSEHDSEREQKPSPRPISTGRLNTLPCFHLRPIDLVVHEGPYRVN